MQRRRKGGGMPIAPQFWAGQLNFPISTRGQIMPTTLLFAPPPQIFEMCATSVMHNIAQGALNNYVDRIFPFFDPPHPAWTV